MDRYYADLTINRVHLDANPLEWWRSHQYLFPNLALAAREALALQATSVQSERLFSKIGLLYQNKLRNRLLGESAERSALIACGNMIDVARKLSCEKIPAASLRKEGEELNEDEEDGEDRENEEEEEEEGEEGMEANTRELEDDEIDYTMMNQMRNDGFDEGNEFYWDNYPTNPPSTDSPQSDNTESVDSDDDFLRTI